VSNPDSNNLSGDKDIAPGFLQLFVGTITQRLISTELAATEEHFCRFLCSILDGSKFCVLMGTITERLFGTLAACAPKVRFTCLHFYGARKFLGYFRGCHGKKLRGLIIFALTT
jgi:hypothetical protein